MIHHSRRETVVNPEIGRIVTEAGRHGQPDAYSGKRDTRRFCEGMQLDVARDLADCRTIRGATMHDVSETGISFWSRADISLGEVLFVREFDAGAQGGWLRARVRHVTRGLHGLLVGVEFDCGKDDVVKPPVGSEPRRPSVPESPQALPPVGLRAPGRSPRRH